MSQNESKQIKETFYDYLSGKEHLIVIGVFKKVPSTWMFFLTKGFAWLFSEEFYMAVTNQRLILLPNLQRKDLGDVVREAAYIDFDEVDMFEGPFQNTFLEIKKHNHQRALRLRFKPGYNFMGSDKFDFIAAVKHEKADIYVAQP